MTKLLVSVRNLEEARIVAESEVAILDVKEPDQGALGAATPATLHAIAQKLGGTTKLSFAAGELRDLMTLGSSLKTQNPDDDLSERFDYCKIGLAGMNRFPDWVDLWSSAWEQLPKTKERVAVGYADHSLCDAPAIQQIIEAAPKSNCKFFLLDTFNKVNRKNVLDWIAPNQLGELVRQCHAANLKVVVAGSVTESLLKSIWVTKPDFIGIRGAVCDDNRNNAISKTKLNRFVNSMATFKN